MATEAKERVKRGTELLDKVDPRWWTSVDLPRFSISSDTMCVFGQRYGRFEAGKAIYGLNGNAGEFGFHALDHDTSVMERAVAQEWSDVVGERQRRMNPLSKMFLGLRREWREWRAQFRVNLD